MYQADPSRTDLAEEFRARPFGEHSPDLHALLCLMRQSEDREYALLVMTRPNAQWTLAWKRVGTLDPPRRTNVTFDSLEAAEWHVFKLRWKALTGADCPVD